MQHEVVRIFSILYSSSPKQTQWGPLIGDGERGRGQDEQDRGVKEDVQAKMLRAARDTPLSWRLGDRLTGTGYDSPLAASLSSFFFISSRILRPLISG